MIPAAFLLVLGLDFSPSITPSTSLTPTPNFHINREQGDDSEVGIVVGPKMKIRYDCGEMAGDYVKDLRKRPHDSYWGALVWTKDFLIKGELVRVSKSKKYYFASFPKDLCNFWTPIEKMDDEKLIEFLFYIANHDVGKSYPLPVSNTNSSGRQQ